MSALEFDIVRRMQLHHEPIALGELHRQNIPSPKKNGQALSKATLSRILSRLRMAGIVQKIGRKHCLTGPVNEQLILREVLDRMNASDFSAFGDEPGESDYVVEEGIGPYRIPSSSLDESEDDPDKEPQDKPRIVLFGTIRRTAHREEALEELEKLGLEIRDDALRYALRDLREAVVCILANRGFSPQMKAYALYEAWELLSLRLEVMNASESDIERIGMTDLITALREDDGVRLVEELHQHLSNGTRDDPAFDTAWPSSSERRVLVAGIKAAAAKARKKGWDMARADSVRMEIIEQLNLPLRGLDFPPLIAVLAPRGFSGKGTKWSVEVKKDPTAVRN